MNKTELNLLVLCQQMPVSIGLKETASSVHCAGHLLSAHSVKAANSEESFTSTLDQTRGSLQGKQIFFIFGKLHIEQKGYYMEELTHL